MSKRHYHIVAMHMPIVYTAEGDHDPNGMLLALKPVAELLEWAKKQWYANDQALPSLHFKRQRAQLVIEGLERLDIMVQRLATGTALDQKLLDELEAAEKRAQEPAAIENDKPDLKDAPRDVVIRHNVTRQIKELQVALKDLGDSGLAQWRLTAPTAIEAPTDPAEGVQPARPIKLVTLSSAQRHEWIAHWSAQAQILDRTIENMLRAIHTNFKKTFTNTWRKNHLQDMPLQWVEHLLYNDHHEPQQRSAPYNRFNPLKQIPAVRPLVLRACESDDLHITVENSLSERLFGFFTQGKCRTLISTQNINKHGVRFADGSYLGKNIDSRCKPGQKLEFLMDTSVQGVWPINDLADVRGGENGTNCHGLFGALVIEPKQSRWRDPKTGEDLTDLPWSSALDVDVISAQDQQQAPVNAPAFIDFETDLNNNIQRSFREFTVFIHDEPEVHSGLHAVGEHTVMPLSYRAEPMHNRLPHRMREYAVHTKLHPPVLGPQDVDRTAVKWELDEYLSEKFFTALRGDGQWLEQVAGEEQHHSSWLFGEPVTHIQRAYAGDPCRVRLVHAGVKETHIYHLHVHEWHAVASNNATPSCHSDSAYDSQGRPTGKGSQLLDSITISPQTAMTIAPLFGSGSRQHAIGDIVWHCHLYPHFHHGMWGLWRSHDREVDGSRPYPDGSYCPPLKALPGFNPLPSTATQPGFPWFIDGVCPMKSPPPPAAKPEQRNGRRIVLGMPAASTLEKAAMAPGCGTGEQPGALFVDLDGKAALWNQQAGLPPPRKICYDIEVRADEVKYNVDGWHDPIAHHYRLKEVTIYEKAFPAAPYVKTYHEVFTETADNPEPIFPRANHGDIVEWRQHNLLPSFPPDRYDVAQAPVECGLHVHLVKFDVLAADGSATGWNYLSGASCTEAVGANQTDQWRNVSLHRWVVDEEFGACFFHDHLLANFRQKHGLFAALIAQPHGSQWLRVDDQDKRAWGEQQAVIVPPRISNLPAYREACLGVADFIPLLDKDNKPLNPPGELSGDDDPGAMGVNYRCAPLTTRGKDPSLWFSVAARSQPNMAGSPGDPDTPIIQTYPGERLRIRLIQGSHEEQHSFTAHGLRWRRDWGHPHATLVNQQTLGISEAFTLDINPNDASRYSMGDYLWHFGSMDDIWLGCWGLVRALPPTPASFTEFAPIPVLEGNPVAARERLQEHAQPPTPPLSTAAAGSSGSSVRTFVVAAQRHEHEYAGKTLTDPWGLIYRHVAYPTAAAFELALKKAQEENTWKLPKIPDNNNEPLVLRAHPGQWIRVILVNDLLDDDEPGEGDDGRVEFGPETSPARLPLENLDELLRPNQRKVSSRVSLHPCLLRFDVRNHDGSYVGRNPDSTVASRHEAGGHGAGHAAMGDAQDEAVIHRPDHHSKRNWREYWWYADEHLAPQSHTDGCGQVCYLVDMADIRNHRHHGLIGALIVEPHDAEPFKVGSKATQADGWSGLSAELRDSQGKVLARESCWFVQDGLRFFVNGNPELPLPDVNPKDDPEDSGQKAVNYRSHPVHHGVVARADQAHVPKPILQAQVGDQVWLRVIGGNDKPRQHSIVVHGCAMRQANWMGANSPMLGAMAGIAPGRVENMMLAMRQPGDYAIRTGCFLWGAGDGIWASIRIK